MFSRSIIFFALLSAKRQALNLAISGLNLAAPARKTGTASLLAYAHIDPTGKSQTGRAAKLSSHLQLVVAN